MASILRKLSLKSDPKSTNHDSSDNTNVDTSIDMNEKPLHQRSLSTSSTSSSSSTATPRRIYGARDYKLTSPSNPIVELERRSSIFDEFVAQNLEADVKLGTGTGVTSQSTPTKERKSSIPFGSRHYALAFGAASASASVSRGV